MKKNKQKHFGIIYRIKNRKTGKLILYVGQASLNNSTCTDVEKLLRYALQTKRYKTREKDRPVIKHIKKHGGIENFECVLVRWYLGDTHKELKDRLNDREEFFIKKYNTYIDANPNGLNETTGGSTTTKVSEKARKNQSEAQNKRYECPKAREDQKKRNIKANGKKIYAMKLYGKREKPFATATEAAEYFGVSPEYIGSVLNGRRQLCKGYQFRYADGEYREYVDKYRCEVCVRKIGTKKVMKFPSQRCAEDTLNIPRSAVNQVLNKEYHHAKGYQFWKVGDTPPKEVENYREDRRVSVRNIMNGRVKVFKNQATAAKAIGVSSGYLSGVINGVCKTVHTYQVWYTSEKPPKFMTKSEFENRRKGDKSTTGKAVICISPNGKKYRFGSTRGAEQELTKRLGVRFHNTAISGVAAGKRKHHRHWKFSYA